MRSRRLLAAIGAAALPVLSAALLAPVPAGAEDSCSVKPGGAEQGVPWAQTRLNFQQGAWPVTQGAGVLVGVVDSGLDVTQPQLGRINRLPPIDVIAPGAPGSTNPADCYGHGSAVAGIIAAPPTEGVAFTGVAPQATILPIKQTNAQGDNSGTAAGLAAGIRAAVDHHATIVNVSVTVTVDPDSVVRAAIDYAAAHDVVVVAAAGNDGATSNLPAYPAAYATQFANLLAVSATDATDQVAQFSDAGHFVSVAAPGQNVEAPAPHSGYQYVSGTSFAAPYVTGTAALVRAALPRLTAAQVCARIEHTADPPGASVPDTRYGYGVVNPARAVTSLRDDALVAPPTPKASPLPAPVAATPTGRHLQHLATAIGVGLLGLAGCAGVVAAVVRRVRSQTASRSG